MLLLLLNYVVLRALWKIDVHLISTLVNKSLYYVVGWFNFHISILYSNETLNVLDVACYDDKLLSVLLVEDTEDETPVLLQLPLSLILGSDTISITSTADVNTRTDMYVLVLSLVLVIPLVRNTSI